MHRFNAVPAGDMFKLLDRRTGETVLNHVMAWEADEAAERLNDDVARWADTYKIKEL